MGFYLLVNAFHLPRVKRSELGILSVREDGYARAVVAARVDAHRDALFTVYKDLEHALVDEYPELQGLVIVKLDGSRFRSADLNIRKCGRKRRFDRNQAHPWICLPRARFLTGHQRN